MSQSEWADKDYYGDLGVSSDASKAEIRRAYRKIARENHPDTNPDDEQKLAKFKAAASAYDVLGDEKKRKEYDEFKAMLRAGGGRFGGAGFPGGFRRSSQSQDGFFSQGGPAGAGGVKTAVWVTSSAASSTAAVLVGTKLGRREAPTSKPPLRSTFEKLRKARRSR